MKDIFPDGEEISMEYFKKGAEMGNPFCMLRAGDYYFLAVGSDKNPKMALKYYESAAKLGSPEGMKGAGNIYYNAEYYNFPDPQKCGEKMINYYTAAAEMDYTPAMLDLAHKYECGLYVDRDYEKVKELYEKAAELGDPVGYLNLGRMCLYGYYAVDFKKGIESFEKAIELGEPQGYAELGRIYLEGSFVEKDYDKAFEYLSRYEEESDLFYGMGVTCLGYMYYNGYGVERDYEKALHYFLEGGGAVGLTYAADMFFYGTGIPQDYMQARAIYQDLVDYWDDAYAAEMIDIIDASIR